MAKNERYLFATMVLDFNLLAPNHSLYGVLRRMMFSTGVGVFDRNWRVVTLDTMVHTPVAVHRVFRTPEEIKESFAKTFPPPLKSLVFPEFNDQVPFTVDGERLMERIGLVWDTDDVVVHRLDSSDSNEVDLILVALTGGVVKISTRDIELYESLDQWLKLTTGEQFRRCFL